jgi:hypothetical protein
MLPAETKCRFGSHIWFMVEDHCLARLTLFTTYYSRIISQTQECVTAVICILACESRWTTVLLVAMIRVVVLDVADWLPALSEGEIRDVLGWACNYPFTQASRSSFILRLRLGQGPKVRQSITITMTGTSEVCIKRETVWIGINLTFDNYVRILCIACLLNKLRSSHSQGQQNMEDKL